MGRYERIREVNRLRDVLERILTLLLLMASLADHAAGLPLRRRRAVLGILACGEAEARALVFGMAAGAPACGDDAGQQPAAVEDAGSSVALMVSREPVDREPVEWSNHEDGARLAAGLRVLALALGVLLAKAAQSPILSAWMKASCGMSTLPNCRMRFLPSCFSSSLRVTSPP